MQQRTTGKNQSTVAVVRTGPQWYGLYPVNYLAGRIQRGTTGDSVSKIGVHTRQAMGKHGTSGTCSR